MFFAPDLLCKRSGKFAVIWTAAMKRNRLKRRDFESVDLIEVCSELEKLLSPSWRGQMATVQGFSLRLSAQLIHGVTVVYNMKITYLYKDANKQYQLLHKKNYVLDPFPFDLPPQSSLNKKDKKQNKRDINEANINFVDPLFGQPLLPEAVSPSLLAATQSYLDIDQPLPEVDLNQIDMNRNTVQDLSTITMQEPINMEFLPMPDMMDNLLRGEEFGQPIQTVEELNMLVNENPDNFLQPDLQDPQSVSNNEKSNEEMNMNVINNEEETSAKVNNNEEKKASDETPRDIQDEENAKEITQEQQKQEQQQPEEIDNITIVESLNLGPAPERQQRVKRIKLKKLITDKETQLENNQMISNLRSPVETVDIEEQTQYRMHLPPTEMLFHYPMHWFNVNKPTKDDHFNDGRSKEDESDVDYLVLFRDQSRYVNDSDLDQVPNNTDAIVNENVVDEVVNAAEPQQGGVPVESEKSAGNEKESYDEILEKLLLEDSYIPEHERTKDTTRNDSVLSKNTSRHIGRNARSSMMQNNRNISQLSLNQPQQPADETSLMKQPSFNDPSFEKINLDVNMSEMLVDSIINEQTIIENNNEQVAQAEQQDSNNHHSMERKIYEEMKKGNFQPEFSSLVPTTQYNKLEAAKNFYQLLVLAKQDKVELNQGGCFEEILIVPNSNISR